MENASTRKTGQLCKASMLLFGPTRAVMASATSRVPDNPQDKLTHRQRASTGEERLEICARHKRVLFLLFFFVFPLYEDAVNNATLSTSKAFRAWQCAHSRVSEIFLGLGARGRFEGVSWGWRHRDGILHISSRCSRACQAGLSCIYNFAIMRTFQVPVLSHRISANSSTRTSN